MDTTKATRPLHDALNKVGVGVMRPFAGASRDMVIDTLRQAHALTIVMSAAMQDMGELGGRDVESALGSTTEAIKADAIEALGSLIALASALAQEG